MTFISYERNIINLFPPIKTPPPTLPVNLGLDIEKMEKVALILKTTAHPMRITIVQLLAAPEQFSVNDICERPPTRHRYLVAGRYLNCPCPDCSNQICLRIHRCRGQKGSLHSGVPTRERRPQTHQQDAAQHEKCPERPALKGQARNGAGGFFWLH